MKSARRALLTLAFQALCCAVLTAGLVALAHVSASGWTVATCFVVLLVECAVLGIHLERFWVVRATERERANDARMLAAWHARHPEARGAQAPRRPRGGPDEMASAERVWALRRERGQLRALRTDDGHSAANGQEGEG